MNLIFVHASIGFAAGFLALLILLHFLKPEFDPSWRMISEYEIGRFGWMMRLAFFCWGVGVLALLIPLWSSLRSGAGTIGRGWLILIVIALWGAGIFKTNPITETVPNTVNTIHTLCGAIVILTFPVAATLLVTSLIQNSLWLQVLGPLVFGTLLVWLGLISFLASSIISRMIDPSAGRVGPKVYLGWPNRFLVVTYILWLFLVAGYAARIGVG